MTAELKVVELENKKGVPYSTLEIYVLNEKTGENLKVASLYLQDTLKTLLTLLDEQNKSIAK
jgi:hypothetical protein